MNNFEKLLRANGINKTKFGIMIGVKGSTIPKYIVNPKLLRVEQVLRLANTMNISCGELIRVINGQAKMGIL